MQKTRLLHSEQNNRKIRRGYRQDYVFIPFQQERDSIGRLIISSKLSEEKRELGIDLKDLYKTVIQKGDGQFNYKRFVNRRQYSSKKQQNSKQIQKMKTKSQIQPFRMRTKADSLVTLANQQRTLLRSFKSKTIQNPDFFKVPKFINKQLESIILKKPFQNLALSKINKTGGIRTEIEKNLRSKQIKIKRKKILIDDTEKKQSFDNFLSVKILKSYN